MNPNVYVALLALLDTMPLGEYRAAGVDEVELFNARREVRGELRDLLLAELENALPDWGDDDDSRFAARALAFIKTGDPSALG